MKPLTRTAARGNCLWRMEPMAADYDGNIRIKYVIRITFAFPAKLYHFQGLAGRVRPAVVGFYLVPTSRYQAHGPALVNRSG